MKSNSEGTSPNSCTVPSGAVKLDKEKLEQNPEEEASEDIKALQKYLEQFARQKRITLGHTQADTGVTWGLSLGRCSVKQPSASSRLCRSV